MSLDAVVLADAEPDDRLTVSAIVGEYHGSADYTPRPVTPAAVPPGRLR